MSSPPFTAGSHSEPISVIVADDVPEIRQIIQHWLNDIGCVVTCAATGREAVQLIRRQPFDVVITDVLMPDGDGLEVISEMRRAKILSGILAISGGGDLLRADDCLKIAKGLGAHQVLLKPFDRRQLLEAFELALRQRGPAATA